jgi:hypothetical protein
MSEDNSINAIEAQLKAQLVNAQQMLAEIQESRQKAQSEALFAFQAKQNCEEHSTFITQRRGVVEADIATITSHKQSAADFVATISAVKASVEGDQAVIQIQRNEAKSALQVIVEGSEKAEKMAAATTDTKTNIDLLFQAIQTLERSIKSSNDTAENSAVSLDSILSEAKGNRTISADCIANIKKDELAAAASLKEAKQYVAANQLVLTHIQESDKNYLDMLAKLKSLCSDSEELKSRVEELLPGATSAALASSFRQQAERFRWPKINWMACFIVCIAALIVIALPGYLSQLKVEKPAGWDSLLLEFVHRLPLLIPLVWLAIYSGRNYMMAVRLEEDYSYKEAVSRAFEGYKEQMQTLGDETAEGGRPLLVLCNNVLKALAERPGRIYENYQRDITPANALIESAFEGSSLIKNHVVSK